MIHIWRTCPDAQHESRGGLGSVEHQYDLTVRRGRQGYWWYCFFKWTAFAFHPVSPSESCVDEEHNKQGLQRKASHNLCRRQFRGPPTTTEPEVPTTEGSVIIDTGSTSKIATAIAATPSATSEASFVDSTVTTSMYDGITASPTPTGTSLANDAEESGVHHNRSGLSQGTKVGLGVGFGIGATLLILLFTSLFFVRRRKRHRIPMETKYTPQAQSELSMVDTSYPVPAGPPRSDPGPHLNVTRHSQAYTEPSSLHETFDTPVSAVTQRDGDPYSQRQSLQEPLTLKIPGTEVGSVRSRDLSPVRGESPVSPVSPVSAITPVGSRPPSSNAR